MNEGTDVFISGGGIAGLAAAAGFAARGLTVTLVDPSKPDTKASDPGADLRSTAFLQPARSLLEANGVWDALAPHATPLETLQVIDTAGDPPEPLVTRAFQSSDISDEPFGWNIPNWLTRSVLTDVLTGAPNVDLRIGAGFDTILTRETEVRIRLTDGSKLKAGLAVAADGRASPLRTALGIDTKTVRYGQKALAFAVTHDEPHHNISTELYHQGGAFVLVPLPDHQGKPASSVVWMHDARDAVDLAKLPEPEFNARATDRSTGVLGNLTRIGGLNIWPVVTQTAERLTGQRTAIIAEAAHVMPPIGAQGLNTSLHDVASLLEAVDAHPGDPGDPAVLRAYDRARGNDIAARSKVIDIYNRVCKSGKAPITAIRSSGLRLVHDVAPLRRGIMRAGLGNA